MKKFLTLALAVPLFLIGCKDTKTDGPVLVQLDADVEATSKAPINSTFTTDFPIGVYGVDAVTGWAATNLIDNDLATVLGAAGHNVTFASGPYYYPANGDQVNFYAFAPQGTITTAPGIGTPPSVTLAMTGQEDIMWCTAVGYKSGSSSAQNPILNFAHKLTQLQFTFTSGTAYPATGYKVVSLLVKAQPTSAVMNVNDGTLTFSGSADMQALTTANQTAGIMITAAGNNAFSPLMTKTSSAYVIDVVVKPASGSNVTYTNIPVTLTSATGSSHMITVTFNETAISATATVADWVNGTGGSAVAQ